MLEIVPQLTQCLISPFSLCVSAQCLDRKCHGKRKEEDEASGAASFSHKADFPSEETVIGGIYTT